MLADLDLLLIAVFCTTDDLLPESTKNDRRRVPTRRSSRSASPSK
jgi:hypothetical protein